jgi:hypothetical protein
MKITHSNYSSHTSTSYNQPKQNKTGIFSQISPQSNSVGNQKAYAGTSFSTTTPANKSQNTSSTSHTDNNSSYSYSTVNKNQSTSSKSSVSNKSANMSVIKK